MSEHLDPLRSFIKLHLGAAGPEPADAESLRMELADLQQKCNLLMGENKELRNRVRCWTDLETTQTAPGFEAAAAATLTFNLEYRFPADAVRTVA